MAQPSPAAEAAARVEREREAHERFDVLGESWALKKRFPHSLDNPARNRLRERFHQYLIGAEGKRVLDFGCGRGEYARVAAAAGAIVTGIDISEPYIRHCQDKASEAEAGQSDFRVMDAHNLSFDDNAFDIVIGNGILHHLDIDRALAEVRRVLKPGGIAVFQEPLADNPLLKFFRRMTPKARTEDEAPLTRMTLDRISKDWRVESEYYGLVSAPVAMLTSVIAREKSDNMLGKLGYRIERFFSGRHLFDSWHQYVLLQLKKPG